MLNKLIINNYKLIDNSEIIFSENLNIITGETGSGKSIILSAIKMLLGDKGSTQHLKNTSHPLAIEGFFTDISPVIKKILINNEIEIEDELHIYRRINSSGKNNIRINGFPVNVAILKEISDLLVEFCSQNQHQMLFSKKNQKNILDSFSKEISTTKSKYSQLRQEYIDAKNNFEKSSLQLSNIEQEKDFLKFQLDELVAADIKENEENELEKQHILLKNQTMLKQNSTEVIKNLSSIDNLLRSSAIEIEQIINIESGLNNILSSINDALYNLEDSRNELSNYASNIDAGDMSLDQVEERLFSISSLKRKFGQDLFKAREEIEKKLDKLDNPENSIEALKEKMIFNKEQTIKCGQKLTELRITAASSIEKSVKRELHELNLEHGIFKINIDNTKEIYSDGLDKIEFVFTANPDKPLEPLAKVASGGEISRVMLALKTVFINNSENTLIVFDEIDTGISGVTAKKVSEKINKLASHFQVICVTHLPTVATKGNTHFTVQKKVENNQTMVTVQKLNSSQREEEIVRLLGANSSEASRKHAKELLT